MIEKDVFATGLGILAGNFNRSLDAAISRAYYAVLSPRLTTPEFECAVSRCLAEETFWPPAAVLLAKAGKLQADVSAAAFDHVNRVVGQHGGYRFLSHDTFHAEFDAPTRSAIAAVGGLAAVAGTPEDRWPGLARRFCAAHTEAMSAPLAIAAAGTDGRVLSLVRSTAAALSSGVAP